MTDLLPFEPETPAPPPGDEDVPRTLSTKSSGSDRAFRIGTTVSGTSVLVITGAIGAFLGYQTFPTLHRYGAKFLTTGDFDPSTGQVGISSAIVGTVVIAIIALVVGFPLALATALYITEYAPKRIKNFLVSLVDLMAAIPSVIFGAFGFFFLMPQLLYVARWISEWFGWIPIFKVPNADPRAATLSGASYEQSAFCAGCVVALMVIPLAASVMMNVFTQAPVGEREGALALGATRWGMIRAVVLPFGKGGIIGGTMLGLGRALGETIAVLLIIEVDYHVKVHILDHGAITISSLIANNFGDATPVQLKALLAAGFVLFLMTLVVNTLASVVVGRSRSGAGVDV